MSNRQDGRSLESSSQIARVDASGSALSIESCSMQSAKHHKSYAECIKRIRAYLLFMVEINVPRSLL